MNKIVGQSLYLRKSATTVKKLTSINQNTWAKHHWLSWQGKKRYTLCLTDIGEGLAPDANIKLDQNLGEGLAPDANIKLDQNLGEGLAPDANIKLDQNLGEGLAPNTNIKLDSDFGEGLSSGSISL